MYLLTKCNKRSRAAACKMIWLVDAGKTILLDSFSKLNFWQGGFYVLNADGNKETVVKHHTGWAHWPAYVRETGSQKTHSSKTKRALWPWRQCGSPSLVSLAGDHCYSQQIRAWMTHNFILRNIFPLYAHTHRHTHRDYYLELFSWQTISCYSKAN